MLSPVRVSVDCRHPIGKIKPMHGIGQPPITGLSNSLFSYLSRAGIPYSRLHDVEGWMGRGLYVDIPNLFRDFDADENDPASYDFAFTDRIVSGLIAEGVQPYFRLGVSIENEHAVKTYRLFPPKDFEKWARVCEHVIRHYNEGFADGYRYGITYWEIWNEPDDCYREETAAMWKGTPEEYYRLYSVTARHLKQCFGDGIKVGGYGHCGVYEYAQDTALCGLGHEDTYIYDFTISFLHGFLHYQKETGAPIDFFSWHVYDNCHESTRRDFTVIREHAAYVRRILDHYGFVNAESHLNEWNLYTKKRRRDDPMAAAKSLAFMLMMQDTPTDLMCFYDGGIGYSDYRALINADSGYPYRNYYAFAMFSSLYRLGTQVKTEQDGEGLFASAARRGRRAVLLLANPTDADLAAEVSIDGFSATEVQIARIDEENRCTLTGESLGGTLTVPSGGCVEVQLFDLSEP